MPGPAGGPIAATWYDGRASRGQSVAVHVGAADDGVRLGFAVTQAGDSGGAAGASGSGDAGVSGVSGVSGGACVSGHVARVAWRRMPLQVGNARQIIPLDGGASLEILDGPAFAAALLAVRPRRISRLLPWMERSWRAALLATVLLAAGSALFIAYGVPALTLRALNVIPEGVDARIGRETLAVLDRAALKPSRLPEERQRALQRLFTAVTADAPSGGAHARLELRHSSVIGPNAFALPSGIVVLTDELTDESVDDDELRGVLAHEVGHLVRRHAMRKVVQNSATALLLLGLFGDVNSASSLAAGVPTALIDASYSRDLEREADGYAVQWMRRHDVPPERMGELLARVVASHGGEMPAWLSSHPGLAERVRAAQR